MIKIFIIAIIIIFGNLAFCQKMVPFSDTTDLSQMSIEELSKLKSRYVATDMEKTINQAIEAASRKPLTLRKSPSIISVITEEEIEKSGAKDLMDVFKLIPGMEFNVDVEGVVALSFRGMWANEGNILLQYDGQEMNESAYSSLQFGNHYPISQIKKIEVIRGPGSAIYGGCAEYAVINIITKKGEDLKGINANAIIGQTANAYSKQNLLFSIGNKVNDFTYSLSGLAGRGQRSNLDYTDINGKTYSMPNNADLYPIFLNINLGYKYFSFTFIYDNYTTTTRDGYINALSKPYPCNFFSYMAELKYNKKLSKKFHLQTKFNYKHSEPWTFEGQPAPIDSSYGYYEIYVERLRLNANLTYTPTYWLNASLGIDGYYDMGYKPDGQMFRTDSTDRVSYLNYAPFAQILLITRYANVTIGARYDISSAFGSAFNPRLGITKRVGNVNFKLLYASSFRAPSIEDIQYAIDKVKLKPEHSTTLEFETSVKLTKDMYISINLFDITTTNAIRYFVKQDSVIQGDPDGYRNTNKVIGSQGLELEYKYKSSFGFINFIYSYYTIGNKGVDSSNIVSLDRNATLGNAQNKFTLMGSFNVGKYYYITPSINFLGERYGYASVDANGNGILSKFNPQAIFNIYAGCNNLVKNLSFGLGVSNITDEKVIYLQAYNSMHASLPGMGREYYIKMSYNFSFKKDNGL